MTGETNDPTALPYIRRAIAQSEKQPLFFWYYNIVSHQWMEVDYAAARRQNFALFDSGLSDES